MIKLKEDNLTVLKEQGDENMITRSFDNDEKVMQMIITSDPDYIKELIDLGGDPNGIYQLDEGTCIFPLSKARSKEKVDALINNGAYINKCNDKGQTALMLVKDPDVIMHLIELGADCKIKDCLGRNAIFYHVKNIQIMKMLILKGADPFLKDIHNITAYSLMSDAMKEAFKQMITELKETFMKMKKKVA